MKNKLEIEIVNMYKELFSFEDTKLLEIFEKLKTKSNKEKEQVFNELYSLLKKRKDIFEKFNFELSKISNKLDEQIEKNTEEIELNNLNL